MSRLCCCLNDVLNRGRQRTRLPVDPLLLISVYDFKAKTPLSTSSFLFVFNVFTSPTHSYICRNDLEVRVLYLIPHNHRQHTYREYPSRHRTSQQYFATSSRPVTAYLSILTKPTTSTTRRHTRIVAQNVNSTFLQNDTCNCIFGKIMIL